MMNATYAKKTFTDKTISEVLSYIAMLTCVTLDFTASFQSEWHKYDHHRIEIGKAITEEPNLKLRPSYFLLRYQIAVYGIFVERFLNRK